MSRPSAGGFGKRLNVMILAIDGYEANEGGRVGIGRFAHELLIYLSKAVGKSAFSEVRVYLPDAPRADMPKESSSWKYRVVGPKTLWTFFGLPAALSQEKPQADVVFSPTHYIPRFVRTPKVMAIMDVSYLLYPELFRPQDLVKLTRWTAYSVARVAKIITISEFSKHAIIKAYNVPDTKVQVTYPAIPSERASMKSTTKTVDVPKQYILSVGTLQPRKNFARLIEAFATIPAKDVDLVIVGKKGWLYDEILAAPKQFGVEERVKFLDFVPDEQLPALYKGAFCFALPSLYEGFGLPVLEAMSYGCPVVVSDSSSLPEIAGEAGIYVNPENVQSIASGLTKAIEERETPVGVKRVAEGKKRVKLFSWEKAAKDVLSVLAGVAEGRQG